MRFWPICFAMLLLPGLAGAGPWSREKGSTFLSLSYSLATPIESFGSDLQHYGSVYIEHGLGRRLTFGLDAGMDAGADYTAVVFLRRALDFGGDHSKFAVQTGLGVVNAPGGLEYLVQTGASWGRGLNTRFGHGWAVLDTSVLYNVVQQSVTTKADLTLGIKPTDRTKLMLQLQAGDYPGAEPYLRLVPSVARKFGERTHIELGAQIGVAGDENLGLKLGTWLEF